MSALPVRNSTVSLSQSARHSGRAQSISALALVCSLALPAAAFDADPGPTRFAVQAAEVQPNTDAGRFSILTLPKARATAPRFQLVGAKSAQAGSACEQVDALFMDGFED
jgi:hypothetical protein